MFRDKEKQSHEDALYEMIGYVIERCPKACDQEMQDRFQATLRSFHQYVQDSSDDAPEGWESVYSDSIGRNYLIAHAAVLQKFANRIRDLVSQADARALQKVLADLDTDVERNFGHFFAESFATTQ